MLLEYGQGHSLPTSCANPFQPRCTCIFYCSSHPLLAMVAPYFDLFYLICKGVVIKNTQPSSTESTSVSLNCALRPFLAKTCINQLRLFLFPCNIWLMGPHLLSSVFYESRRLRDATVYLYGERTHTLFNICLGYICF